jgi:hypothetical protein
MGGTLGRYRAKHLGSDFEKVIPFERQHRFDERLDYPPVRELGGEGNKLNQASVQSKSKRFIVLVYIALTWCLLAFTVIGLPARRLTPLADNR